MEEMIDCDGTWALGTACGKCGKCRDDAARLLPDVLKNAKALRSSLDASIVRSQNFEAELTAYKAAAANAPKPQKDLGAAKALLIWVSASILMWALLYAIWRLWP